MKPSHLLLILSILILGVPILVIGNVYLTQEAQIFPRTVNKIPRPDPAKSPFEKLAIQTPDGQTLNGILFPSNAPSATLIIAFGGNAHDVVGMASFLKNDVFANAPVTVAGLSYRGYPNVLNTPSTGTPSQENLYADATTIYDTLTARLHPQKVYAVGYSLGTAVSAHLATQRPLSGIVLIAPPASIRRLAEEKYPWLPVRPLLKYPFATEDMLGSVTTPVSIFYTETDGLIPASHIAILKAAQPGATVIALQGSEHGNILFNLQLPAHLRQIIHTSAITSY